MHETIKKLKTQATSYTWNGNDVTEELDEELFAQLIIQECANVAVTADSGMCYTADIAGHVTVGRWTASNLIRQHFGVE